MRVAPGIASLMLVASLVAATPSAQVAPAAGFTGTWEAVDQPYSPWIFNLEASGNKVTGRVWQEGGLNDPAEISEGRVEGATVSFSYSGFSRATRAQRLLPDLAPPQRGQNATALNAT